MSVLRRGAVVIGASAGAVQALLTILPRLPADYPLPIFITVHVPPDRGNGLVPLLQSSCALAVAEAEDKEAIRPGTIYLAPPDYHLLVEREGGLALSSDEPVNFSRPSIDVLFESAADAYQEGLIGIVLTGANNDGAAGLKAIAARRGQIFVERPEEAYASTMPEAALAACPQATILSLDEIGTRLVELQFA